MMMFRGRKRLSFQVFLLKTKGVFPKSLQTFFPLCVTLASTTSHHMPVYAPITGNENETLPNYFEPI